MPKSADIMNPTFFSPEAAPAPRAPGPYADKFVAPLPEPPPEASFPFVGPPVQPPPPPEPPAFEPPPVGPGIGVPPASIVGGLPAIAPPVRAARPTPDHVKAIQSKIQGMRAAPRQYNPRENFDQYMTRLGAETQLGGVRDMTPEQWQLAQRGDEMLASLQAQRETQAKLDAARDERLLAELQKLYGIGGK